MIFLFPFARSVSSMHSLDACLNSDSLEPNSIFIVFLKHVNVEIAPCVASWPRLLGTNGVEIIFNGRVRNSEKSFAMLRLIARLEVFCLIARHAVVFYAHVLKLKELSGIVGLSVCFRLFFLFNGY